MKRLISLSLICIFIFLSCSNDDDSNTPENSQISGEWNLVNIMGGFAGIDQDFEKGTIIWDFDESTNMVTVINNATVTDVYTGLASGTYSYSISAPADVPELIVNEANMGVLTFEDNTFTTNELPRDGFRITFER